MPRLRLAVVLTIPGAVGREVDGLRRALGDSQLDRIAPHVTLIPPVNVAESDLEAVLATVRRAAAARSGALGFEIGPVETFLPANPVLFLAVSPATEIARLHDDLHVGPFDRRLERDFIPHVTIDINRSAAEIPGALALLADFHASVAVERVEVMQLHRIDERDRWVPVADAVFGGESNLDAGSVRLTLTESTLLDPPAANALHVEPGDVLGRGDGDGLVITARTGADGRIVGLAAGRRRGRRASVLRTVYVDPAARHQGVGRRLVAAWERAAVCGGARRAVAPGVDDEVTALLAHLGWGTTDPILDRRFEG